MSAPVAPGLPGPAPPAGTTIRTLAGVAGYRCGHSGACCRAGWPIPVEARPLAVLRRALQEGRLPATSVAPLNDDILGRTPDPDCAFHGTEAAAGCRLEQALGAEALPSSCRQFPRLLLVDDRGWHQSLSAWCVTVAHHLARGSHDFLSFDYIPADPRVHVDALDARGAWPPELRPGLLMSLDDYAAFETRAVSELFAVGERRAVSADATLGQLVRWSEQVRTWRPGVTELRDAMTRTLPPVTSRVTPEDPSVLLNDLTQRITAEWRPTAWPVGLTDGHLDGPFVTRAAVERALHRYLALRLVGSWMAYQGQGLRSVVASLVSSHALVCVALSRTGAGPVTLGRLTSALRAADWLQLHLLDREAWAAWCAQWEHVNVPPLAAYTAGAAALLDGLAWDRGVPSDETSAAEV